MVAKTPFILFLLYMCGQHKTYSPWRMITNIKILKCISNPFIAAENPALVNSLDVVRAVINTQYVDHFLRGP